MGHGGRRPGAGRPKGVELTKPVRIPTSKVVEVKQFLAQGGKTSIQLPLYSSKVRAGFPTPADDTVEALLDLNELLVPHPATTFLVRAHGQSMVDEGIHCGDILVVDKSLEPTHGKIVIAALNGELTVKRLYRKDGLVKLLPANPAFPEIVLTDDHNPLIWGVVTNVIHEL